MMVAQGRCNDSEDTFPIAKHFMVPEPNHPIPFFFQDFRTRRFDDQLGTVTGEIGNVVADRDLAAKVPLSEGLAEQVPKRAFRIGHITAKSPCAPDSARRWVMLQACRSTTNITPPQPLPIKGRGYFFSSAGTGATHGLNAPPGTAEATGLSNPSALTDDTPNTQSSTRMCGKPIA